MDKSNMTVQDWDDHYTEVPDAPDRAPIYKLLLPLVAEPPRTILDIGCGTGAGLAALGHHFPDAHLWGIDYSPRACEIAHERFPQVRFLLQDVVQEPIHCAHRVYFDLALCVQTLEHFNEGDRGIILGRLFFVALKQIIISVPYGDMVPSADHKAVFDEHSFDSLHPTEVVQVSRYHMAVSWVVE